jgi:O-antigen/teichoic acid export membrane protein
LSASRSNAAYTTSLTSQVLRGAVWNAFGIWSQKALGVIAVVVLARLLTPADYAIAGLAGAAMGLFRILIAHGFGYALVQRKELDEVCCHSIFWFLAFVGMGLSGLVVLLAPWIAQFYSSSALVLVIQVLSFGLIIGMISSVPRSLLQRAMRFREINFLAVSGSGLSALLGVGMAWMGYGYWALIAPGLGASLFTSVLAFWISGYRPKRAFQWAEIKRSSNFGVSVTVSNILGYLGSNIDYLVMGRFWNKTDFGQYYFAFENFSKPHQMLTRQLGGVLLPAFSRVQDDLSRLRRGFLGGTRVMCLVVCPVHVLLIGLADPLIPWIFGEQWRPSVPVFQVFFLHVLLVAPSSLSNDIILALNRPQFGMFFNALRISVTLPVLLWLGMTGAGIVKTAICLLFVWLLFFPLWLGYSLRLMRLSLKEMWHYLRGLVTFTAVMALVLVVCRVIAQVKGWPTWLMVLMAALLPSAVFLFLARNLFIDLFKQIRTALVRVKGLSVGLDVSGSS